MSWIKNLTSILVGGGGTMSYELKHIRGIPYFLRESTVHTFQLQGGQPSPNCVPIGTYHADTGSIEYFHDWSERIQPHLDAFRAGLVSCSRDALRDSIDKPQKQRKAVRNPRKSTSRTKNPASESS